MDAENKDRVDFGKLINELISAGVSSRLIQIRTGASYSRINRIKRNEVEPSWLIGEDIISMHKYWCIQKGGK